MNPKHRNLYRATQVQVMDRTAIDEYGIDGAKLMTRAGQAAFKQIRERWPDAKKISVLCGPGNNGGDGFVVARLAYEAGLDVEVFQLGNPVRLSEEAQGALNVMKKAGLEPALYEGQTFQSRDLVVDAMLGIGLSGEVSGQWRSAIETINRSDAHVLAIDVPSGLHADLGIPMGACIIAEATISFIGLKQGLFTANGPDYAGEVIFDDLEIPPNVYKHVQPSARLLDYQEDAVPVLLPRPRSAHKSDFGHVLVIGGNQGMSGAVQMAAEAALRAGAGRVSVATRSEHASLMNLTRPELMCHGVEKGDELKSLLEQASVVVAGPGLGRDKWAQLMLKGALAAKAPLVLDADALNLIAGKKLKRSDWTLTPHPGEAARLLGVKKGEIQADRFQAITDLKALYGGTIVLKGSGSLVLADEHNISVCEAGNPGMATAGSGDILAGLLAGLQAQGMNAAQAARCGTLLHAMAGDIVAENGQRGMLATDLLPPLRSLLNP
jgi:NAD(P)H-hydrate epimerase